jgi:phage shock protein C
MVGLSPPCRHRRARSNCRTISVILEHMNNTLPRPDTATYVPPARPRATASPSPRLVRPRDGRRLGGVCAGIADKFGWSRTTVRVLALLSILLPGPQVIAYLVAWFVVPDEADGQPIVGIDVDKATNDVAAVIRR